MKKIAVIISLIMLTVFCSDAEVLSLRKIRDRTYNPVTLSKEFKQEILKETKGLNEREIVLYCNKKTQEKLTFVFWIWRHRSTDRT